MAESGVRQVSAELETAQSDGAEALKFLVAAEQVHVALCKELAPVRHDLVW